MAIEPNFVVTIPAVTSIRIRESAMTITAEDTLRFTIANSYSIRTSASVNTGTISGDSQLLSISKKASISGRFYSNFGKYLLKKSFGSLFKGFTLQGQINKFLNNARMTWWLFLVLAKLLAGLAFEGVERIPGIGVLFQPKPINKVIMISYLWNIIRRNANHRTKKSIGFKFINPIG